MAKREINPKQAKFIEEYSKHGNAKKAAIAAGYSQNFAATTGYKLLRLPQVQEAIEEVKSKILTSASYNLEKAMKDLDDAIVYVKEGDKAPMALPRLLELKSKLNGLLVEKHHIEVEHVDISPGIQAALARLSSINNEPAIEVEAKVLGDIEIFD